jgi:hypothetical protein
VRGILTTLIEVASVAAVIAGVAFYSIPAALIALGGAGLLAAWRLT